jgi:hypothetical protein
MYSHQRIQYYLFGSNSAFQVQLKKMSCIPYVFSPAAVTSQEYFNSQDSDEFKPGKE